MENNSLETVKRLLSEGRITQDVAEEIFPELKESEDEKIKKEIINYFKCQSREEPSRKDIHNKWIVWLEKQGEQKSVLDFKASNFYVSKVDGKIHDITYNSTDKVEPKFKVGDTIRPKGSYAEFKITGISISEGYYKGKGWSLDIIAADDDYELVEQNPAWSEDEKPLLEKFKQAVYDCAWGKVTCKAEGETKEEYANRWAEHFLLIVRDWADDYIDYTIQQKLRKSYDEGKKDAIKTNSPAWSEEDEKRYTQICVFLQNTNLKGVDEVKASLFAWLKELKERYTWRPSNEQIKAIRLARAFVTDDFDEHPSLSEILVKLEEQLEKLKG